MDVVRKYWNAFSQKQGLTQALPDAWMFGDGSEKMGNELGQLVVQGLKTGTCSSMNLKKKAYLLLENMKLYWMGKIIHWRLFNIRKLQLSR